METVGCGCIEMGWDGMVGWEYDGAPVGTSLAGKTSMSNKSNVYNKKTISRSGLSNKCRTTRNAR